MNLAHWPPRMLALATTAMCNYLQRIRKSTMSKHIDGSYEIFMTNLSWVEAR